MTWLYTLDPITRQMIRVPYYAATHRIDWDAAEAWTDPPSKVRDDDTPCRLSLGSMSSISFRVDECLLDFIETLSIEHGTSISETVRGLLSEARRDDKGEK